MIALRLIGQKKGASFSNQSQNVGMQTKGGTGTGANDLEDSSKNQSILQHISVARKKKTKKKQIALINDTSTRVREMLNLFKKYDSTCIIPVSANTLCLLFE